jgi:cobalt-zinc-cadmium efflux system membrane fusion protein
MMNRIKTYFLLFFLTFGLAGCRSVSPKHEEHEHEGEHAEEIHFSEQKFRTLSMKVDTLPMRNINSYVEANGQFKVPPQNNATVTAVIGANVHSIRVREGDHVKKGQTLAFLSHPDLIRLQTDYVSHWNQLQFLEKEYLRQTKLQEEKIGSGKEYERIASEYRALQGTVKGYQAQLSLLGLNADKILKGSMMEQVPLPAPISGYIQAISVRTGQYAAPETNLFEIVNTDEIYAELMVFEKDLSQVKVGQQVYCRIESCPDKPVLATVQSVGKTFEQDSKAIHLYAAISETQEMLVPGMYVRGSIMTSEQKSYALPEEGIVREGDKHFIFIAEKEQTDGDSIWAFRPLEVIKGAQDDGWVEVKLLQQPENDLFIAMNNAYYLQAEFKKGETEHQH